MTFGRFRNWSPADERIRLTNVCRQRPTLANLDNSLSTTRESPQPMEVFVNEIGCQPTHILGLL